MWSIQSYDFTVGRPNQFNAKKKKSSFLHYEAVRSRKKEVLRTHILLCWLVKAVSSSSGSLGSCRRGSGEVDSAQPWTDRGNEML